MSLKANIFAETSKIEKCCMEVHTSPECLDACKSEDNCHGADYQAALIILQATKCASFANKFKQCCEGIIWNFKLNVIWFVKT